MINWSCTPGVVALRKTMIRALFNLSSTWKAPRKIQANANTSAALRNAQETGFRERMENHLADNRSGLAFRSTDVHDDLRERHQSNVTELGKRDPVAEAHYLVAMASLNYDGQARMAATIHTSQQAVGRIYAAHEHAQSFSDDLKAITENMDLDSKTRTEQISEAMQKYAGKVG
jgi:hypothetical protein